MRESEITKRFVKFKLSCNPNLKLDYIDPPSNNINFEKYINDIKTNFHSSRLNQPFTNRVGGPDVIFDSENGMKISECKGSGRIAYNFQTGIPQLMRYADNVSNENYEYSWVIPEDSKNCIRTRIIKNEGDSISEAFEYFLDMLENWSSEWNIYFVSESDVKKESFKHFLKQ